MKISKVEPLVKEVLEDYEEARNDDFFLISEVFYKLIPDVTNIPFTAVMLAHNTLKLPSIESITRSRRKLQAKYEHLRASERIEKARAEIEEEYIEYSRR